MKPICKSEARWKYWRDENPKDHRDNFKSWAKKQMARARRRFLRDESLTQNDKKNF